MTAELIFDTTNSVQSANTNIISFMTISIEADLKCPRVDISNSNINDWSNVVEYLLTMKKMETRDIIFGQYKQQMSFKRPVTSADA